MSYRLLEGQTSEGNSLSCHVEPPAREHGSSTSSRAVMSAGDLSL